MNFTDGVWAVEYARGFIPLSIPFGLFSAVWICYDFLTSTQTWTLYSDLVAQAIGRKCPVLKPITVPISWVNYKITKALTPAPEVSEIPKKNIRWFQRET
jgi:hypothetical protein